MEPRLSVPGTRTDSRVLRACLAAALVALIAVLAPGRAAGASTAGAQAPGRAAGASTAGAQAPGGVGRADSAAAASPAAAANALERAASLSPSGAPPGSTALGPVPSTETVHLTVVLAPSDQAGIDRLVQAQEDRSSPEYHRWLAPGAFPAEFGPAPATVSSVETWLRGAGLTSIAASGFTVDATGSARVVASAFGTRLERYRSASGSVGYTAEADPLVPRSLAAGQISAIFGLDTLPAFVPQIRLMSHARAVPAGTGRSSVPAVRPDADGLTACSAAADEALDDDDYDLDQLGSDYGLGSLLADGENGASQTVGVYELEPHSQSDVATYLSCFGLHNSVATVAVDGGGSTPISGEADADIEQVATQAPEAHIVSYEGPNTEAGAEATWATIVDDDAAKVVSTSWGECEPYAGSISAFETLFERAATQGQTILAAAGDQGSEGCFLHDDDTGLAVSYPASDASVTAVGGTSLVRPGDEEVWNYCQPTPGVDCAEGLDGRAAGGGGFSQEVDRPAYQSALALTSVGTCGGGPCRIVPDLSANAGVGMVLYIGGGWLSGAGTSLSAPLVAGLVADRNTGCRTSTGQWNTALYALAAEGAYGTALNDVTSGDNDMTGTNGGQYRALSGYDAASGLGSPIAAGLSCPEVTSIAASSAYPGTEVTLSGLGLEHASISFGGTPATVLAATATHATVTVPPGSGTVAVTASSVLGAGTQGSSFTYPVAVPGAYTALQPVRICDTRPKNPSDLPPGSQSQCNGETIPAGGTVSFDAVGTFGTETVPAGATAVIVNVTVTDQQTNGLFTVYSGGVTKPVASDLNYSLGVNVANLVEVGVGTSGRVDIFSSAKADAVVDLQGYVAPSTSGAGLYEPLTTPTRICDTRPANPSHLSGPAAQCDGPGDVGEALGAGKTLQVQVAGVGGVPGSGVSAAVLNVTATVGRGAGYLTVFPAGSARQLTSNLNFGPSGTVANRVIVPVSSAGAVELYSPTTTDVLVDVSGWFSSAGGAGAEFTAEPAPVRICDTRDGNPSGLFGSDAQCNGRAIGQSSAITVQVSGMGGVPKGATSVVFNLTATGPTRGTYLAVYSGGPLPLVSDLNPAKGETVPNLVVAALSASGTVTIYNSLGSVNAVVDVAGWYAGPPSS